MPRTSGHSSSARLLALAAVSLAFALLCFLKFTQPDTATLESIGHALSSPPGTDSSHCMNMGETAFRAPGHRIFPGLFFAQHQKFIYPPSSLFLIETLNRAPAPDAARQALLLASWLGTILLGVLFFRDLRGRITALEAASIALLGFLFLPLAEALYRGQIQLLLTFLWALAALLWQRERRGWAGFVLALTCAFKPQLALFLLWGALRKQWRFTGLFAATAAIIAIASVAHFGLQNNIDYVPVLGYLSQHGEALWANQSMNGLLNRLLHNGNAHTWSDTVYPPFRPAVYLVSTAFTIAGILLGLLLPRSKHWDATTADLLFFGCISVIISPIVWEHHYGAFFFLLVFLLARADRLSRPLWLTLVICTLLLSNRLPPLDKYMSGPAALLGAYLFYTGLLMLALLAYVSSSREKQMLESR